MRYILGICLSGYILEDSFSYASVFCFLLGYSDYAFLNTCFIQIVIAYSSVIALYISFDFINPLLD